MPRRRTSNKPIKRRTTTGCAQCRSRKIKCDEAVPTCGQCSLKRLICKPLFALKWESDYVQKGLAFGRSGRSSRSTHGGPFEASTLFTSGVRWCQLPYIHLSSFIEEDPSIDYAEGIDVDEASSAILSTDLGSRSSPGRLDSHLLYQQQSPSSSATSSQQLSTWSPLLRLNPSTVPLDADQGNLFVYFQNHVCPQTTSSLRVMSPFAALVLPYSISASSFVLEAVLAVASCHRARIDPGYKPIAQQHGGKALHTLREKLNAKEVDLASSGTELLVVMMLLCLSEIVSECDGRWVVHLRGAKDLIQLLRHNKHFSSFCTPGSPAAFAERFFAFQDVIGRTACGETIKFGQAFWDAADHTCDPWLGCSPSLVSILCQITELSRERSREPHAVHDETFKRRVFLLENELQLLEQEVLDPDDIVLAASADVKKKATLLYFYCALCDASPVTPVVKVLVEEILTKVAEQVGFGSVAGLIWPLFMAAVELEYCQPLPIENSGDRPLSHLQFVLDTLEILRTSATNVSKTRTVIEQVWTVRVAHAGIHPGVEAIDDPRNDWERFVAPFCSNMSLA